MNSATPYVEVIINRGQYFLREGYSPSEAAERALLSPLDVLIAADNLKAPEQGEAGCEWYLVSLRGRDAALVAATVTALAALTHALATFKRGLR